MFSSETRLLEIVEAACEKTDFECNQLLEQIEDQVETWWFHRYVWPVLWQIDSSTSQIIYSIFRLLSDYFKCTL